MRFFTLPIDKKSKKSCYKKEFLMLLMSLLCYTMAYAGYTMTVFKAKLVLKNGTTFTVYHTDWDGYLQDKNGHFVNIETDKGFQKFLNHKSVRYDETTNKKVVEKLRFYKAIYTTLKDSAQVDLAGLELNFGFCHTTDILDLHPDSIQYTVFLRKLEPHFRAEAGIAVYDSPKVADLRNHKIIGHASLGEDACGAYFVSTQYNTQQLTALIEKRKWAFKDLIGGAISGFNPKIEAELAALGIYMFMECVC